MGLHDWIRRQIGKVPDEDAVCEFDCRRLTCRFGDWERCDRRRRGGLPADLKPGDPPERAGESGS
jgi:hypothetical protein